MRKTRWILGILVCNLLIAAICLGAFWLQVSGELQEPLAVDGPTLFKVVRGVSFRSVAKSLENRGWVDSHQALVWFGRLAGLPLEVQAGTYEILPNLTLKRFLDKLARGETKAFSVTFVEGSSFSEIRAVLAQQPYLRHSLGRLDDGQVARELDLEAPSPEGMIFPATYFYQDGSDDLSLLRRAADRMQQVLLTAWRERKSGLPYRSPYETLIMASIVEKETALADERPLVAGVFVRRLQRGMRLQTDPTVIFGLGAEFDGDLKRQHLKTDTPYNTYTRRGLPPTPIAMPGEAAIKAALQPAEGDALFFVATGDGGHHFSASLDEHNAAVRRYQLGME
jgi:UPF0755 protein